MTSTAVEPEAETPSVVAVGRGRTWIVWSARGGVRLILRGVPATARALKGVPRATRIAGRLLPAIVLVLAIAVIVAGVLHHRRRKRAQLTSTE